MNNNLLKMSMLFIVGSILFSLALSASVSANSDSSTTEDFVVDFESEDCFKIGLNGLEQYCIYNQDNQSMEHHYGQALYWNRGGYGPYQYPELILVQPENSMVHTGESSAKLCLTDPSVEGSRRLEILHDWHPQSEYMYNTVWYYFPSELQPIDSWIVFHRVIYERMWDLSRPWDYQHFQISIGARTDGRSQTLGQQVFCLNLGKGNVDNDNDGEQEFWDYWGANLYSNRDSSPMVPNSWLTQKEGFQVPFDQWFKMETLVYRNMTNWNNGYIRVWIDDELIWDVQGTRTIGIDPETVAEIDNVVPPEPQAFLSSGFGLYTAFQSSPKTIFVDNVELSNRILGDINGDGRVDVLDAIGMMICLVTPEEYCSRCDLNRDGSVDVLDACILCDKFGKSF